MRARQFHRAVLKTLAENLRRSQVIRGLRSPAGEPAKLFRPANSEHVLAGQKRPIRAAHGARILEEFLAHKSRDPRVGQLRGIPRGGIRERESSPSRQRTAIRTLFVHGDGDRDRSSSRSEESVGIDNPGQSDGQSSFEASRFEIAQATCRLSAGTRSALLARAVPQHRDMANRTIRRNS